MPGKLCGVPEERKRGSLETLWLPCWYTAKWAPLCASSVPQASGLFIPSPLADLFVLSNVFVALLPSDRGSEFVTQKFGTVAPLTWIILCILPFCSLCGLPFTWLWWEGKSNVFIFFMCSFRPFTGFINNGWCRRWTAPWVSIYCLNCFQQALDVSQYTFSFVESGNWKWWIKQQQWAVQALHHVGAKTTITGE